VNKSSFLRHFIVRVAFADEHGAPEQWEKIVHTYHGGGEERAEEVVRVYIQLH
jgi:hypothetical protein